MATTRLASPQPRSRPTLPPRLEIGFREAIFLPRAKPRSVRFEQVAARRKSTRNLHHRLSVAQLGALLWLAAKNRQGKAPVGRPDWRSRPYPSAGGCHEIEILVANLGGHEDTAFLYDSRHHALGSLPGADARTVERLVRELRRVLPGQNATVLWFVADPRRLAARYRNPESLLWRDSGALGATLALAATAVGLGSCLVGIHAPAALRSLLGSDSPLIGVGGCIVGPQ